MPEEPVSRISRTIAIPLGREVTDIILAPHEACSIMTRHGMSSSEERSNPSLVNFGSDAYQMIKQTLFDIFFKRFLSSELWFQVSLFHISLYRSQGGFD